MTSSTLLAGRRIAIVGAGPIGLEAALYASALGAVVRVYERSSVAQHIDEWGHIQLFTPFGMNHTPLGRRALEETGHQLPGDEILQSGAEWRESYLLPLAEGTAVAEALVLGATVITIGRGGLLKGEAIGNGIRSSRPFRLLIERDGAESYEEADMVLDCSGSWANPNWLGVDGVPALGERECRDAIEYHPIDVAGARRDSYAGRRTLLIGDGLSAATTAVALARLAADDPGTQIVWATRGAASTPIQPLSDDPLPRRVQLTETANRIATDPTSGCEWLPGSAVHSIRWLPDLRHFEVVLETPGGRRASEFDRVIANVGYEPDNSLYKELQVHECYASRGPMKLSASILAASADAGGDCLQLGGFGPEVLLNPEPGFFILGMKSYGRNSAFLLQTGHEQVRDAFRLITEEPELDLYADTDVLARS
jgi:thioredoxin reductase